MPLAGERFATDLVQRTSDTSTKDYRDFMSRWDERLGRELTDAELAARKRVVRDDAADTPVSSRYSKSSERERENQAAQQGATASRNLLRTLP